MRREAWNKGLGEIDPELVEEYIEQKAKYAKRAGRMPLVRAIAVAACVCVVVGAVIALPIALRYGSERWLSIPDDTTSENGGALSEETTDTTDTLDPDDMFAQGSSSDTEDIGDANSAYASSYELKTVGDQLYMVFDSYEAPPIENEITDGGYGVTFDSIEDFQRGVIKDTYFNSVYEGEGFRELSKDEMYYIVRNFERDENGIPIIDMYNLYLPDMPEGWELGWGEDYPVVDWRDGDEYVVYVSNPAENKRATFRMLSYEDYTSQRESAEQAYGEPVRINSDKFVQVYDQTNASGKHTLIMFMYDREFYPYRQCILTVYDADAVPEEDYILQFGLKEQYAKSYKMLTVDDQHYLTFDSYERYPISDKNIPCDCLEGYGWESIDDLIPIITANNHEYVDIVEEPSKIRNFTIKEIDRLLRDLTRDEIGIPIFNADNPYIPTMPEGWEISMVEWIDGCELLMRIDEYYLSSVRLLSDGALTVQGLAEESGTLVTDGDRTVLINTSQDHMGYNVEMKVVDGELCYVYNLCGFEEMPSQEYLLSFGVQKRYASEYELKYVDGQLYMVFDSYELGGGAYWFSEHILSSHRGHFNTVDEFIEIVTNTAASNRDESKPYFETWELMRFLSSFYRDEIGIPIVDIYNLPIPDAPVDYTITSVSWTGGTGLHFKLDSDTIKKFRVLSPKEWGFFETEVSNKYRVENGERTAYLYSSNTLLIRQGDVYCEYEFYEPYEKEDALLFGIKAYQPSAQN